MLLATIAVSSLGCAGAGGGNAIDIRHIELPLVGGTPPPDSVLPWIWLFVPNPNTPIETLWIAQQHWPEKPFSGDAQLVVPKQQFDLLEEATIRASCHMSIPDGAQGFDLDVNVHDGRGTFGCLFLEPEACAYLTKLLDIAATNGISDALEPIRLYQLPYFCRAPR
jgi:hypothetical protein